MYSGGRLQGGGKRVLELKMSLQAGKMSTFTSLGENELLAD